MSGVVLSLEDRWLVAARDGVGAAGEVAADVAAAARRGDVDAFVAVMRFYDPMLRTLAYRLLGTQADMDDAMQEASLRVLKALPKFKGNSALGTWLYRITYRACLDQLRRRSTTAELPADYADTTQQGDPAELVDSREALRTLLAQLPVEQRAAVILVDQQDLDYRTAASILGVPTGTVASRLAAGRAFLRRIYAATDASGEGR